MELVIIIVIVGALYAIFKAKIKGVIGEKAVAAVMSGLPKVAKVQSSNITEKEVRKEHVKQIRAKVKAQKEKVAAGI